MSELIREGGDAFGKALLDFFESGEDTLSKVIRLAHKEMGRHPADMTLRISYDGILMSRC